jgi:hypothetical protein
MLPPRDSANSAPGAGSVIHGTKTSKPLAEYAGTYRSKWLGNMFVYYENRELYFQFHKYHREKMKHAH